MKVIHLDFAPRSPQRIVASMVPLQWMLVAVGLAVAASGVLALHDLSQQNDERRAALELIRSRENSLAAVSGPRTPEISEAQASAVNHAVERLNLPWSSLLIAIERGTPAAVALLALETDAKRHLVKGVAEAKSTSVMLEFISRLKQQAFLANAILTKHEIDDQVAGRPVHFEFEAEWREAGQ